MNINLFIAKTLWRKGTECKKGYASSNTVIAQISVVISFLVIISSIVISDGFRYEIKSKASGFSGDILLKSPGVEYNSNIYPISDNFSFKNEILSIPDVKSINSYAYRSGMIKYNDQIQGVVIKGVNARYDWNFFKSILSEGSLPDFNDTIVGNEVLLSHRLAEMMGLKVGDEMPVYFIDKSVRVSKFLIKGIFDAQLEQIDRTLIISDIREVQRLNNWNPAQVSGIEIQLRPGADRAAVANSIQTIVLEKSKEIDSQMDVTTVDDLFPHLFDWLRLLDFNVMIVLGLMMLVAGFNMLSGLLILLFEKISVIGLLKALGMRNMNIHGIFMYKGFRIVLSGMIIGNIIALAVALLQKYFHIIELDPENYFVKAVPIHFDFVKIATVDIISVLVIMTLMLLPSLFVSRVSPDRIIRVK
ncbi:MAG: ABC transporter permease [Rikenellaceae bacterium]|nr:ABC transporter permease [Rikenellaceae bacterium]